VGAGSRCLIVSGRATGHSSYSGLDNRTLVDTTNITRRELNGYFISGNGNEILHVVDDNIYECILYQYPGAELSNARCCLCPIIAG
jgi:hypothetical protein